MDHENRTEEMNFAYRLWRRCCVDWTFDRGLRWYRRPVSVLIPEAHTTSSDKPSLVTSALALAIRTARARLAKAERRDWRTL
jgi:hypothetical protein